jgi:hypothetical protein
VKREIDKREYEKRERYEKYSRFDILFGIREREEKLRREKCSLCLNVQECP